MGIFRVKIVGAGGISRVRDVGAWEEGVYLGLGL